MAGLLLVLAAGCTGADSGAESTGGEGGGPAVEVTISPEDGATEVAPNSPITVEAADATITDVRVEQTGGAADAQNAPAESPSAGPSGGAALGAMTGTFNEDKTTWVSDWNLTPGAEVTVTATAENSDGEEAEVVSQFSTLEAVEGKRLELQSNFPTSGQTVGVGMPVIINFDLPVENKEQVENSMEVTSEQPVQGAWNWFGDQMAVFRPEEYWEPNQSVTVDLHLAGVEAAEGVYGIENHQINFEVGREQITTVDDDAHTMTVERDGETVKTFPISNGRGDTRQYTTTSGIHLTMEKYEHLVMDSSTMGIPVDSPEGYKLDVNYAVRFSNSGEFTHAAPWNGQLGEANASHGCTNMSTADAKWFYEESLMGDPFIVTGTDRQLEVDNGWGYWQRSWEDWLANSATGEPDTTDGKGTPGDVHGEQEQAD
ncbi:lipoprotein-anchoring transpeptidase ErfK/SrfK [Streptomonospora nanhaiensis]|uniref:Lipoprotein-anchoring transpeptidase ErfK/SrfK n=1 Tax=Streptomonospora nanhaiensis TaxID=1323731 RepID=A0A853BKA6_9ACTN|nr:Ig-like domain-containing protein [Streptomonospora nanhaiensis]NYI94956.1 lipoprotein-anchoring transpeptidase ErfK/SrfK [Streptomonospora nanhaiensis]